MSCSSFVWAVMLSCLSSPTSGDRYMQSEYPELNQLVGQAQTLCLTDACKDIVAGSHRRIMLEILTRWAQTCDFWDGSCVLDAKDIGVSLYTDAVQKGNGFPHRVFQEYTKNKEAVRFYIRMFPGEASTFNLENKTPIDNSSVAENN